MELKPLFNYIAQFVQLTSEEQSILESKVKIRKYLKGQFVVQNGDICKYENFVLSGCLKTFYIDNEGQEHIVMFAVENWWTADLSSFITQTPADYNIQCLENSVLAQIYYEDLEQLYVQIPKLERFFRIIIQKAYISSQKRIINNFSLPAKDRYVQFREKYPQIEQRVPQYMIASYLGITKEFLSKIRSQLIME
ncbi:MAG TPA: Crp/Fnr family transcriptional regulator [Chitinophagaceae bacterium]|nr:Crp/Fnr family transcriptional regulator [Chitinophagaceae bacterium]